MQIDTALAGELGLNAEKAGPWMVAGHFDDSDDMDNRPNDAILSPGSVLSAEAAKLEQSQADGNTDTPGSQMRGLIRNRGSGDCYRRREELRIQITSARADELDAFWQPVHG